jgi:hypothetical protein
MSNVPVLPSDELARRDEIMRDAGRIPKTMRPGDEDVRRTAHSARQRIDRG